MKKCKGISLMLAAMLLAQSCVVPAMASDTDTYPQENGYYVETAPEDEAVPEEEDPQYWAEAHRGEIQNSQLAAYGVDHSWFTPRPLKDGETLRKGVDISQFQGNIDWATVKKNGIEFAFIRVGYRGWGTGSLAEDKLVYQNLQGAIDSGIQVGVYIYSQAITVAEVKEEAQFVLSRIRGYSVTLPVVIDYEYADDPSTGRLTGRLYQANLSKNQATAICNAFCEEVTAAGYRGAVYANKNMLEKQLNPSQLTGAVWLAHYASKTDYGGDHEFWQCTSSGYVEGIPDQNVDLDYWYDAGISALPFKDVAVTRWSYEAILQAYERGLINGMSPTRFDPAGIATRGQLATMLYRLSGSPEVTGSSTFTDLTMQYYRDPIAWAQQNGVINGVGKNRFAPETAVTRQDMITMLYRLSGEPETKGDLSGFKDADKVAGYAKKAVVWAVENDILKGSNDSKIMPRNNATREQVATFLVRYISYAGL